MFDLVKGKENPTCNDVVGHKLGKVKRSIQVGALQIAKTPYSRPRPYVLGSI